MIRVTVMYPNTPDSNFDWVYGHTSPPWRILSLERDGVSAPW